jgi:alpha-glucosidase
MATFTPVMRTHEGNRPADNFQFDQDEEALAHFAKMTQIYVHLKPYIKSLVELNAEIGIPVQRPLFMHYEDDMRTYDIQYQYLFGKDILVAPVHSEARDSWPLYLPNDNWVHLFTGMEYKGGDVIVEAQLGCPPVFYRRESLYRELFSQVRGL